MNWREIDWNALERMRTAFLDGTAGQRDYWHCENDLANYNATFAQRIAWKWDYVLAELKRRGWSPPPGDLLDWGCGSGVASRAFLDQFGTESIAALHFWDRSALAMQFARKLAREKYPNLKVAKGLPSEAATVVISHVLTELDSKKVEELVDSIATHATSILWVEPGTYDASRTLIAVRERLRGHFHVIAPCPHQAPCGLLAPENKQHWCHHFAAPPREVFTDSNWGKFARIAGIDLRSLPVSFLVLDKRPLPPFPPGATRTIGRPRVYKPSALLLGCDEGGVRDRRLSKRAFPEEFRLAKKGELEPLLMCEYEGDEIRSVDPLLNSRRVGSAE